mgnify:CR=1|jgi:hypothetical protein
MTKQVSAYHGNWEPGKHRAENAAQAEDRAAVSGRTRGLYWHGEMLSGVRRDEGRAEFIDV